VYAQRSRQWESNWIEICRRPTGESMGMTGPHECSENTPATHITIASLTALLRTLVAMHGQLTTRELVGSHVKRNTLATSRTSKYIDRHRCRQPSRAAPIPLRSHALHCAGDQSRARSDNDNRPQHVPHSDRVKG
jgi:hypothetical protein